MKATYAMPPRWSYVMASVRLCLLRLLCLLTYLLLEFLHGLVEGP